MSVYAVNKVGWLVVRDEDFRARLKDRPAAVLASFRPPLEEAEQQLLLAGDVGALARRGAHTFLLNQLARLEVLGLNRRNFRERMIAEYAEEYPLNLTIGD